MRCKKASPSRPPEAKLRRTFSKGWCSALLEIGMKNNITKGAADMSKVEPKASSHKVRVPRLGLAILGECGVVECCSWLACLEYLNDGGSWV